MADVYIPAKIALIGAGNIGSRHLQGLAFGSYPLEVYVVEQNAGSSEIAALRLADALIESGNSNFNSIWLESSEHLPREIDIAIVATGATVRRAVVENLLSISKVNFLILEKFLFQSRKDFSEVEELLRKQNVEAFVNTPRRCWSSYQRLRQSIGICPIVAMKVGISSNYGLATNAVHMVDLLGYLTSDQQNFKLNGDSLTLAKKGSRHSDIIEFGGELKGTSQEGSQFLMQSLDGGVDDFIEIEAGDLVYSINESAQTLKIMKNEKVINDSDFPVVYQS